MIVEAILHECLSLPVFKTGLVLIILDSGSYFAQCLPWVESCTQNSDMSALSQHLGTCAYA